jgi:TonB family protein
MFLGIACSSAIAASQTEEKVPLLEKQKAMALYSPRPDYPYEARIRRMTGAGIAVLELNAAGLVTKATMAVSTGYSVLDKATLDNFRQWRFKPGAFKKVRIPIRYTMNYGHEYISYERTKESMDDVLAKYLGKGTLLKGPVPEYPKGDWTFKEGRGVYELHAAASGRVESVTILKSSGDATFDRVAQRTLAKWRLARGPLILELPLRFELTPESYRVQVAR